MADTMKRQFSEETLKILDEIRLLGDDFMTMVFGENREATVLLLNIIKNRKVMNTEDKLLFLL